MRRRGRARSRSTRPARTRQTCNILYPREAAEAVGGFDESIPQRGGEDLDLAARVRERGAPVRRRARRAHLPRGGHLLAAGRGAVQQALGDAAAACSSATRSCASSSSTASSGSGGTRSCRGRSRASRCTGASRCSPCSRFPTCCTRCPTAAPIRWAGCGPRPSWQGGRWWTPRRCGRWRRAASATGPIDAVSDRAAGRPAQPVLFPGGAAGLRAAIRELAGGLVAERGNSPA